VTESPFAVDWRGKLQCDIVTAYTRDGEVLDAIGCARRIHLAIMREPWASYIADGSKRVESRWGKVRCAPHDAIDAGDIVVWKRAGGPVYGVSCVAAARTKYLYSDSDVAAHVARHAAALCIKIDATPYLGKRLLTLVHLGPFRALPAKTVVRCEKRDRSGWAVVLDAGLFRAAIAKGGEHA